MGCMYDEATLDWEIVPSVRVALDLFRYKIKDRLGNRLEIHVCVVQFTSTTRNCNSVIILRTLLLNLGSPFETEVAPVTTDACAPRDSLFKVVDKP